MFGKQQNEWYLLFSGMEINVRRWPHNQSLQRMPLRGTAELYPLGLSANLEPFIECTDVRQTESSSECKRRIRLRHVATGSDLVGILARVN